MYHVSLATFKIPPDLQNTKTRQFIHLIKEELSAVLIEEPENCGKFKKLAICCISRNCSFSSDVQTFQFIMSWNQKIMCFPVSFDIIVLQPFTMTFHLFYFKLSG